MSKSLGNFYYVRGLMAQGADPLAIRFALISGVYRKNLNFTDQGLEDAKTNIDRFRRADAAVAEALSNSLPGEDLIGSELDSLYEQALEAMLNDLNTPIAISKVLEGAKVITRDQLTLASAKSAEKYLNNVNDLLGIVRHPEDIAFAEEAKTSHANEARILEQIEARKAAKAAKDWALADSIRKQLLDEGIVLTDNSDGSVSWALA
jgi:cysteinyl-tRNA synthetase